MKMYIPFGDWSDDGHGKYVRILVEAPSMEGLLMAQKRIKEKYGERFFDGYADKYEHPYLSSIIWEALIDTNYPIERMIEYEEVNDWTGCESVQTALEEDDNPAVSLDFVIDTFIWLLNAFGAEIVQLDKRDEIPMICNWTCHGFETVGYGCFY